MDEQEAAGVIQKYWGKYKLDREKKQNLSIGRYTNPKKIKELIQFSESVSNFYCLSSCIHCSRLSLIIDIVASG